MITLGNKVRCIVTGFEGIATARVEYLNGCIQFCVTPQESKGSKDPRYVDIGQLKVIAGGVAVKARPTGGPQSNTPSAQYGG